MKGLLCCISILMSLHSFAGTNDSTLYTASDKRIQYTGRVDHSNITGPVIWAPGAYIDLAFEGSYCILEINDELRWGKSHNYIIVIVDDLAPRRIQLKERSNRIVLAEKLTPGKHHVTICKSTEAEIGFIQPTAFIAKKISRPSRKPKRKIEFIGDSITCGMGNDESGKACGKGEWYDQNNAWIAYGPLTARHFNAQWHLSSISGIGLMHSCCNKTTVMPPLFKKLGLSADSIAWNFKRYQPDVVTVCLGQNDGIQDSAAFCKAYIDFMQALRSYYPKATLVMLTSPMAAAELNVFLQKSILSVEQALQKKDRKITHYFFRRQYTTGCSSHPSGNDHHMIAAELIPFVEKQMRW
ncbi:MAG: SGNH/GDSL hydrolase family protein [Ferruginibacter sp.]